MRSEIVLGLPECEISDFGISEGKIRISARYLGVRSCPHCGNERLRNKGEAQSYKHNRHSECRFRNVARKRNVRPYSTVNANDLHGNIVNAKPANFSRVSCRGPR